MPNPYTVPNQSRAHRELLKLSIVERLALLEDLFIILEYDDEGDPGSEWSSDTTQNLGDRFNQYGIVFS